MKKPLKLPKFANEDEEEKFRALLQAGYTELGSEARRLEREFAHLDAQSLRHVDEPEAR